MSSVDPKGHLFSSLQRLGEFLGLEESSTNDWIFFLVNSDTILDDEKNPFYSPHKTSQGSISYFWFIEEEKKAVSLYLKIKA